MTGFLRRSVKNGARVLVGDPDRAFLPRRLFTEVAAYDVPTPMALESVTSKHTRVWEMRPPARP